MNFFEHQDRARTHTSRLVLLFALAIASLILLTSFLVTAVVAINQGQPMPGFGVALLRSDLFLVVAAAVITVVLLGGLYRVAQLRRGGRVIAESMRGRLLERNQADLDELKILNVVEEMALASGLPVPPVYVIEDDAINAFAAGYQLHDAVLGITRGAVRFLTRDELQGVIAHEFSHIFNGDMRLNLRLVGWLHGLLVIGLLGRSLLRMPRYRRGRNNKGEGGALMVGLVLTLLGYTGVLFGNLIKSAVSRQREFLADASAVQYTRNPEGIGNALKKIGGYPLGSRMLVSEASEINHMLFAEGVLKLTAGNWFATHPPLKERIKRIDPRWDGKLINPHTRPEVSYAVLPDDPAERLVAQSRLVQPGPAQLAELVVASVGTLTQATLQKAQAQLAAIPAELRQQLDDPLSATLMMWALLVSDSNPATAGLQRGLLQERLNPAEFKLFDARLHVVGQIPRRLHLAIVELAQPQLFLLSPSQRTDFLQTLDRLIHVDGQLSVYEWGISRVLQHNLQQDRGREKRIDLSAQLPACYVLLAALARAGHATEEAAHAALRESYAMLDASAQPVSTFASLDFPALDAAIMQLVQTKPLQKPKLLKAMVMCVQHDGELGEDEVMLLRATAILLDCPVPPM